MAILLPKHFTNGAGRSPHNARRSWQLGWIAPITLLTACTSVPLPPWAPPYAQPGVVVPSLPAPVQAAPAAGVQIFPVPPPVITVVPQIDPAPYSAAVAARFPAPATVYSTPGLQPGRTTFTTPGEIHSWLSDQAAALSRSAGIRASVLAFGKSQQGEPLEALVLSRGAAADPLALLSTGRPTVLLVGQHDGSGPAGSEALLVIARELAQGLMQPLLERINVLIVPNVNPDRVASGRATFAGGPELSRDHLLLNTPEAQALARLVRDYRPTVVVDAHEYAVIGPYLQKFGALPKFDALVNYSATANVPEFLIKADEEWYRRPLLAALKAQGLSTEWQHSTSADPVDKKVSMGATQPDDLRNVSGLKNAIGLVIETRGGGIGRLHLQRRVHTHVTAIGSILASTAQRASELGQLRPYLDKEVSALTCKGQAVVEAAPTPATYDLLMLDPVSGADKTVTVDWDSTLALRSVKSRVRPCGYWLSAASRTAVERLRMQGVQVLRVLEPSALLGDIYRETSRQIVRQEARVSGNTTAMTRTEVALIRGVIDAPAGSYYVPLNQPIANLAIAALEPDTPSSYFSNQLLDNIGSVARVMTEPSFRTEELP